MTSDAPLEPYTDDELDTTEYETGPFCRHFADPVDCSETCIGCGHECHEHVRFEGPRPCDAAGCDCPGWVERD
jgi:hypothetical protein